MRHFIILIFLWIISLSQTAAALNTFKAKIIDGDSGEPLIGASATVEGTQLGNVADKDGFVEITGIPDGPQTIRFSYLGYETEEKSYVFPLSDGEPYVTITLEEGEDNELEKVVISATRGTRTFRDIPTRVEFIGSEELEEKNLMKPGDIRMLLSESTGIQRSRPRPSRAIPSSKSRVLTENTLRCLKTASRSFPERPQVLVCYRHLRSISSRSKSSRARRVHSTAVER